MYEFLSRAYDRLMRDVDYRTCADFIFCEMEKNGLCDGILLDLACGTGTVSALMAKKGCDVICVDSSPDMLAAAREKLPEALCLCQKMQELDLYGTVSAVVCTLDGLNHITEKKDFCMAICRVSLFLEPGGIFIFDVNTVHKHKKILANNTFVYDLEDVYCVWQNETRYSTTQISLDIFTRSGGVYHKYEESFAERGYEKGYIEGVLEEYGFGLDGVYDGYDRSKRPGKETERLVFVAVKK